MRLFRDERGFTTTSMVLSLLITLSLVFTTAQVYRVGSASAEVQDVADAAALSAENQVAEFMVAARFCDAVVLSLSLTGAATTGLGIAALCTPATATLSKGLIDAGKNLFKARDGFSDRASSVLGKLQEALPYLAAACAAGVASANDRDSAGSAYLGAALLVPSKGEKIGSPADDGASDLMDEIDDQADQIREKAKRAEEAAQEANRCKERAFARDCGDSPEYCMYERAAKLAGLAGTENPLFESVDAWSFSVALDRARVYYAARLRNEAPANTSIAEQARSALRTKYYRYAVDLLKDAYVHETPDSFEANFPHLPSNTSEMRFTSLYTDAAYPVTVDATDGEGEPVTVMHAWMGCPEVQRLGVSSTGSIAYMESAGLPACPTCGFRASSMGKVAAASTSVANGFEYHYEAVADEAFLYEKARLEAQGPKDDVERQAGKLMEKLGELLKATVDKRIDPSPPGHYGALAFVVNTGSTPASLGFESGFVSDAGSLGPRAAVAGATLVDEGSAEGRTAINSALDGLRENGGAAVGAAGMALDAWSWMLTAYSDGQDALTSGIRAGLDALPLVGASGLGTWAADKLESAVDAVGLQPAKVGALKAVLVNSGHVASKDEGSLASGFVAVKRHAVSHPLMSTSLFSSVLTDAEATALNRLEGLGDSVEVASIEVLGEGGPSIPVTIPLPPAAKDRAAATVRGIFGRMRAYYATTTGERVWE